MDIDLQLEELQRELMAVQQEKTNPLSQRTVAEIMVKLYHAGFSFIPTTDGNEYITPEQLDKEIVSLVKERSKMPIPLLPQLLNVGPDTVEARIITITQQGTLLKFNQNIYSPRYFEQLLSSLAQELLVEGKIELQGVAVQHELTLKFVEKIVAENLAFLNAELVGHLLITKQYRFLRRAKILGFLLSIGNPLHLEVLYKCVGDDPKQTQTIVQQLVLQGKVKGRVQSGYYVPDRFTAHQKKLVTQFLETNGYLQGQMLQKKYMVVKPEEWITKNLNETFVKIDKVHFREKKVESIAAQINSMLKSEGFIQLSSVLPIELEEKSLNQLLEDHCGLKDYFLCEGFVYSNEWLEKLASEFRPKIIHSIFFKATENNKKQAKKKNSKKQQPVLTEEELKDTLFNCGFAGFSQAQNLAPQLLPLMTERLIELKKKIQKQLLQSKGFITTAFLKFKSCSSIQRSEQSLTRSTNIIQKAIKKNQTWRDADFGPNQSDLTGQYSLIYYDNVSPKGWPTFQSLKWIEFTPAELISKNMPSSFFKCSFTNLLQLIDFHNKKGGVPLQTSDLHPLSQQSSMPFIYKFHISAKEKRYVIVDNLLPIIEQRYIGALNRFSFCEKAYAKLRYCYKGASGVGVHQMLFDITGRQSVRYMIDNQKQQKQMLPILQKAVKEGGFICVVGQGEQDKRLMLGEDESELVAQVPYLVYKSGQSLGLYPSLTKLKQDQVVQLFRSIFIIGNDSKQ